MTKLTNKQHEQQQDRRLTKLEKRADADDRRVEKLEKRIDALKEELSKHKAKPKH
ncbi:hypothetical protein [Nitrosarchaeum koreense]|uniref:Uncharacterized protein n=1 Tax=Nitrosarchaeum koreense MY1 TaxID=1001994 RepID=F9CVH2_9ARCH|nr:hypothetical protein [Nitrosarchaeum koreense]EGP93274.1 hypothetical protein MY1_0507 [Nitrosarchaeum koreense MY1]